VVTHQLQVERRTGKVRQSETDVLPLCHATNYGREHNKPYLLLFTYFPAVEHHRTLDGTHFPPSTEQEAELT